MLRTAAIALAAAALVQPARAATAEVVATVNGVPLYRADLDNAMRAAGRLDTPAGRQEMLHALVGRELIRQAAERDGLGRSEAVQQAMRKAKVDAENRIYVAEHMQPQPVTDAQVRERYDAIVSELGPQEYRVSVMTLADEPTARFALMRLGQGEPFEKVAAQTGIQAADGNTSRWVSFREPATEGRTQGLPLPLAQALTTLKVGEVTPAPIAAAGRYVVARLDDRRPTAIPSYDSARESLRAALEARQRDDAFMAMVNRLAAKAVIRPQQVMAGAAK
ncbi:peptidylprolyl isomerase [Paraburkholderia kururiensis]|uniref:peptidylprolyl isomerase n=1 Tax=Paraburkholderia kururiensis TaxID=984307 RepID=UPI0005A608C6|nr:peptidylprolyl isomerase [Paraburkholderia kururiensis]